MRARLTDKASRPNLTDVAKKAGVSPSTVSLVLAGKAKERYISDEVIQRVQQAAASLDYSPNMLVRSMQQGRANILCLYNAFRYRQSPTDQYTVGLFTATAIAAGDKGCNLLLFCDFSLPPEETYHTLKGGHSDGVILFAPRPDDPLLHYLRSSRLPTVLLNSEDEQNALSSIRDDVEDGMRQVALRLGELGHRKIAIFISSTSWNMDAQKRVTLLLQFLTESGISVPPEWIVTVQFDQDDLHKAVKHLMQGEDTPTALFCWHDHLGYMVVDSCAELGIDIPGTLSVIGYDGIAWPSRTPHTLASVHVDLVELGRQAVEILTTLVHDKELSPIIRTLPVHLKDGTTLAPPSTYRMGLI